MARYELLVRGSFSAAHRLRLPDGGYEALHVHDWQVELYLEGERLGSSGMLADFSLIQGALGRVLAELDRSSLPDLPAFAEAEPSTEHVARHLHDRLQPNIPSGLRITRVRVWETPECAAAYVPF